MTKSLESEFKKIAGFDLEPRLTNLLSEGIERKDGMFESLSRLAFDEPQKIAGLKKIFLKNSAAVADSERLSSAAGYLCYLDEDFAGAKEHFFNAVNLNPQNYDNWRDLAFALRHLGENEVACGIFFNFEHVIHYYDRLNLSDFSDLKLLVSDIKKKIK